MPVRQWIAFLALWTTAGVGCSPASPVATKGESSKQSSKADTAGPATKTEPNPTAKPAPLAKRLPKEWAARVGAEVGRLQVSRLGHLDFLPGWPDEENEVSKPLLRVPAVRLVVSGVGEDGQSPVADLPAPAEPFGLSLNYPGASGNWLKSLPGKKTLEALDLSGSKVTDADLKDLAGLQNLVALDLTATQVTDAGLPELAALRYLQVLHLNGLEVTDMGLKKLAALKGLRVLYASGAKVSDEGLRELAGLAKLHALYLSGPAITDAGLKHLSALKGLRTVILTETKVTDAGVNALEKATGCTVHR